MGYFRMADGVLDYVPLHVPKKNRIGSFRKSLSECEIASGKGQGTVSGAIVQTGRKQRLGSTGNGTELSQPEQRWEIEASVCCLGTDRACASAAAGGTRSFTLRVHPSVIQTELK